MLLYCLYDDQFYNNHHILIKYKSKIKKYIFNSFRNSAYIIWQKIFTYYFFIRKNKK